MKLKKRQKMRGRDKRKSEKREKPLTQIAGQVSSKSVGNSHKKEVSKVKGKKKQVYKDTQVKDKVSNKKVSKVKEEIEEVKGSLIKGTELIGHTENFILTRFPDSCREGQWYYNVVDKVKAFVWSSGSSSEGGLNLLKYIDTKYGYLDSVFHKNLSMLVDSDHHIKCTLNWRTTMLDIIRKFDFDTIEFYTFEREQPKREKRIIKRKEDKKKVEEKTPVPTIKEKTHNEKRIKSHRREKEVPVTNEKQRNKKKHRRRK